LISGALFDGYAKATNFNGILLQEEVLLWFQNSTWSKPALLNCFVSHFKFEIY
jgi:hypothetical protein